MPLRRLDRRHRVRQDRGIGEHLHPHRGQRRRAARRPPRAWRRKRCVEPFLEDEPDRHPHGLGEVRRDRDRLPPRRCRPAPCRRARPAPTAPASAAGRRRRSGPCFGAAPWPPTPRALTETSAMPSGAARHFCEPVMLRSTPHSSVRTSRPAMDETVSSRKSAPAAPGDPAHLGRGIGGAGRGLVVHERDGLGPQPLGLAGRAGRGRGARPTRRGTPSCRRRRGP